LFYPYPLPLAVDHLRLQAIAKTELSHTQAGSVVLQAILTGIAIAVGVATVNPINRTKAIHQPMQAR
jgi:hypothetical protein